MPRVDHDSAVYRDLPGCRVGRDQAGSFLIAFRVQSDPHILDRVGLVPDDGDRGAQIVLLVYGDVLMSKTREQ